ncbi:GNAT family N-acetyltransferase [Saccharothrix syringae]|uniref:GNAT family N-acetyltransferase n=1 Tax=Saccharothrix syringae TaxID=103733 RepID=A0A5Q0GS05_SACSY|nr:GNAT family N-acetyltransferase [Saccharothrix syringae]QFZ16876.1 GNAT family N-acetyltransferase [Saccharothrix syringae]
MAEVTKHDDFAEFWALAGDHFTTDPVAHTVAVAAVHRRLNHAMPDDPPALLVTASEDGDLVAAALRVPPWPLEVSGVPPQWAEAVADALAGEVELPGVTGPRESAEAFVMAWAARTGCGAREVMSLRLYRLGELVPPDVPGTARPATEADADLLTRWYLDFRAEATDQEADDALVEQAARFVHRLPVNGGAHVLWCDGAGTPVAWAATSPPASGMSRIGPVYTAREHRRRGYGAAVTAACATWAREHGAEHVVLFTDLANPTSNSVYQRIGFRPVGDSAEFAFTRAVPASG